MRHCLVQFAGAISLVLILLRERPQMGLGLGKVERVERSARLGRSCHTQLGSVVAGEAIRGFVVGMGLLDQLNEFALYFFQILRELPLRI